jgi:hypothetical protein
MARSQRHWGRTPLSSGDDACDAGGDGGGQDPSGGDQEVGEPLLGADGVNLVDDRRLVRDEHPGPPRLSMSLSAQGGGHPE